VKHRHSGRHAQQQLSGTIAKENTMNSAAVKTVRPEGSSPTTATAAEPKPAKKAAKKARVNSKPAAPAAKKRGKQPKTAEQIAATDAQRITPMKKVSQIHSAPGTFCYAQIHACLTSKTVGAAKENLRTRKDNPTPKRSLELAWVGKKGYIKVAQAQA
jgi:hypothetical protein